MIGNFQDAISKAKENHEAAMAEAKAKHVSSIGNAQAKHHQQWTEMMSRDSPTPAAPITTTPDVMDASEPITTPNLSATFKFSDASTSTSILPQTKESIPISSPPTRNFLPSPSNFVENKVKGKENNFTKSSLMSPSVTYNPKSALPTNLTSNADSSPSAKPSSSTIYIFPIVGGLVGIFLLLISSFLAIKYRKVYKQKIIVQDDKGVQNSYPTAIISHLNSDDAFDTLPSMALYNENENKSCTQTYYNIPISQLPSTNDVSCNLTERIESDTLEVISCDLTEPTSYSHTFIPRVEEMNGELK